MKGNINDVIKKVQELLSGTIIKHVEAVKNNDVILNGISIFNKGDDAGPVIYIDQYMDEGLSVDEIANKVVDIYNENRDFNYDIESFISDYNNAKNYITPVLINRHANEKLLRDIPFKEFLDLAVILELVCPFITDSYSYIKINNPMLEMWNVSFEDAYVQALANLEKEETVIENLVDAIKRLGYSASKYQRDLGMCIVTNYECINGATHILKESVLSNFANTWNMDIVVIPSSIHEAILLPVANLDNIEGMSQMVKQTNIEVVPPEFVLSNHAYIYRRDTGWEY